MLQREVAYGYHIGVGTAIMAVGSAHVAQSEMEGVWMFLNIPLVYCE